ncbi:uncharacterized protein [Anoplolepis gracilipes]|uniref:uncharacterized protein n=1 Tax=Anoplolepis gracilipes TaxID=354296 RepID=UPI003B9E2951
MFAHKNREREKKKMENVQQKERDLLERSHQVTTLGEYFGWLQHCEEFIEELEERSRVKCPRLSIENRQSLVTRIARLEGAKTRLQRQFIPSGGDYSSENNKMENVQQKERDLLERSHQVTTLGEYFGWVQHCEEFIEELEERSRVKCPRLSIENRQSLVTRIARLEGAKTRLQRQFIPSGGDYSSENNKMENVQQKERDLLERSHQVTTLGEYFGWVQHCEEFIEELEERSRVKCPRLSIENRQSLVTRIARLEGAKTRLQRQFILSGGDYSSENNKMENVQQKERDLLERSHQVTTLGEYFGWVQHCEEFIEELEERSRVKCPRFSIENRQSLVTRIARLEGAKTRLQRQFIPSGGDYSSENNKMENVQQKERDLLERSHQVTTLGEYFGWVQHCEEFIEELEERSRVKCPRLSIGNRQSLVTRIARLEGAKTRLQRQFIPSGGDYSSENNSERLIWREIDTAFESRILTGAVINYNHIEPRQFLEDASDIVLEHVRDVMQKHNSVKVNTVFNGEFVAGDKHANKSINTRNCELLHTSDLREWYERRVVEPILASLEEFQERDSGWALSRILNLIVNINKYNPMRAGCYVQLSRKIIVKRAVVNVQSKDNACFAWAVVAALYPAERYTHRQSSYPHYTTVLNFQDIEFPVTLNQIKKFEIYNDISINVYSFENENIVPIHTLRSKRETSTSTCSTCKMRKISDILHGSRIYLDLLVCNSANTRLKNISAIDACTIFTRSRNYNHIQ